MQDGIWRSNYLSWGEVPKNRNTGNETGADTHPGILQKISSLHLKYFKKPMCRFFWYRRFTPWQHRCDAFRSSPGSLFSFPASVSFTSFVEGGNDHIEKIDKGLIALLQAGYYRKIIVTVT